jgi:hypothetical protein
MRTGARLTLLRIRLLLEPKVTHGAHLLRTLVVGTLLLVEVLVRMPGMPAEQRRKTKPLLAVAVKAARSGARLRKRKTTLSHWMSTSRRRPKSYWRVSYRNWMLVLPTKVNPISGRVPFRFRKVEKMKHTLPLSPRAQEFEPRRRKRSTSRSTHTSKDQIVVVVEEEEAAEEVSGVRGVRGVRGVSEVSEVAEEEEEEAEVAVMKVEASDKTLMLTIRLHSLRWEHNKPTGLRAVNVRLNRNKCLIFCM